MTLLHAAWLQNSALPCLALWADNWQVAAPIELDRLEAPPLHPLALSEPELSNWLQQQKLLPAATQPLELQLSLPTRSNGLPLMAGELLPKQLEWWPWRVSALVLSAP
ncbi:MAG: ATP-dependent helicase, partial [Cyanobacteria bacterium]|nr:ATP-dependent helicase [Cyanobacteriota bacterium]